MAACEADVRLALLFTVAHTHFTSQVVRDNSMPVNITYIKAFAEASRPDRVQNLHFTAEPEPLSPPPLLLLSSTPDPSHLGPTRAPILSTPKQSGLTENISVGVADICL